jgi:hypothetical protein
VERAWEVNQELNSQTAEAHDLSPFEEALTSAERRFAYVQSPEAIDALGDAWAATAKSYREDRDAAARVLGEARANAGVAGTGNGRPVNLGWIWDDLDQEQRRSALQQTFDRVVVSKVSRGAEPELEFVPSTRRWRLEYTPVDLEQQ